MPEWMIEGLLEERERAEEQMVRELEALDAEDDAGELDKDNDDYDCDYYCEECVINRFCERQEHMMEGYDYEDDDCT